MSASDKPMSVGTPKAIFGMGTLGIFGSVGLLLFTKYVIGPLFKKRRLETACDYGESLFQMELEREQNKAFELEN